MSTTGSDHKLVENLRRKLLTNNNDYELQEAREASDRALEAALDNVDDRTPEDTLHNDGDRAPEAKMLNVRHRALGITRSRFGTRAPETTSNKTGTRKPTSTSDTVPDSVSNNSYGVTKSVLQDSEIADVKNALNMVRFCCLLIYIPVHFNVIKFVMFYHLCIQHLKYEQSHTVLLAAAIGVDCHLLLP